MNDVPAGVTATSASLQDGARRFIPVLTWIGTLTFIVMTLGSIVRATDSGLACPDWPWCFAKLIPQFDYQIFLEWFHRLMALTLGLLMVFAVIWLARKKELRKAFGAPLFAVIILFLIQSILGGLTVLHLLDPTVVSTHLLNAVALYGVILWMNMRARRLAYPERLERNAHTIDWIRWVFVGITTLVFIQIALGGMVSTNHAGLVCPDFPTCHGQWLPQPPLFLTWLQQFHRFVAFALLGISVGLAVMTAKLRMGPMVRLCLRTMPTVLMLQIVLGVINIWMQIPAWASALHLANALLLFTLVGLAMLDLTIRPLPSQEELPRASFGAFFQMTKPTITLLVVVTTIPGLLLAQDTLPNPILALAAIIGTMLASASASVFNHLVDQDLDSTMARTQRRPLPTGKVSSGTAAGFATTLGVLSFVILYRFTTPLAAWIAVGANVFYVLIYTLYLKRRTVQNIVIGGAAGAVGPLIGWAAVTGSLDWPAWILFLVIFLWTPPHFWALAIKYKDDYARARVPMLPVVKGDETTRRQIFLYTLTLMPAVVSLYFLGAAGMIYLIPAAAFTGYFIYAAAKLYFEHHNGRAMAVFHYSCLYLFGVFGGLTLDRILAAI